MTQYSSLQKYSLFVAAFASFVTPFMGSAINVALPHIGKEFSTNTITLSWVATAFLLASAVFLVPFGRIADTTGRIKIFKYGLVVFTLATALCPLALNIYTLIGFRALQGFGSAMIFGTSLAIISEAFDKRVRGKAMGYIIGSVYLGLTLGPFAGGILTNYLGWRGIFWLTIPLGMIAVVFSLLKLPNDKAQGSGKKFDIPGTILYGLSISSLMYGFSKLPSGIGFVLVGGGLLGLFLFVIYEQKITFPVFDIRLFKNNRTYAYSNYAALINYSATFAISFLLSLYLQSVKGMSPQEAGFVLVVQPVLMTILSPVAGTLSDKYDPRIIASAGMAFIAVGLFLITFIQIHTSLLYILPLMVIFGTGYALFSSPNTNAIMSSVEKKDLGLASGTVGTMRTLGQMSSMGVATLIIALFMGNNKIELSTFSEFMISLKTIFLIFAILCSAGIFLSLARGKREKL